MASKNPGGSARTFGDDIQRDLNLAGGAKAAFDRGMHPAPRVSECNVGTDSGFEVTKYPYKPEAPCMAPTGPGVIDRLIERSGGGVTRLDGLLDHLRG